MQHPMDSHPDENPITTPAEMEAAMPMSLEKCIDDCERCESVCQETITHCLEMGGRHAEPAHIRLLMDCVEICETAANFMRRRSPIHVQICMVCSEICAKCAEDCASFGEDEMMQRCAQVCQQCAVSCMRMAGPGRG